MIREYDLNIARAFNQVQMPANAKLLGVYPAPGGTSLKVAVWGQAGIWAPREFTVLRSFEDFTPDEYAMGFRPTDWVGSVTLFDGSTVHVFMLPAPV